MVTISLSEGLQSLAVLTLRFGKDGEVYEYLKKGMINGTHEDSAFKVPTGFLNAESVVEARTLAVLNGFSWEDLRHDPSGLLSRRACDRSCFQVIVCFVVAGSHIPLHLQESVTRKRVEHTFFLLALRFRMHMHHNLKLSTAYATCTGQVPGNSVGLTSLHGHSAQVMRQNSQTTQRTNLLPEHHACYQLGLALDEHVLSIWF